MRTHRVANSGVTLAVTEWGEASGPAALLVHGYPDTSAVWRPVAERLARRYRVIAYDVRGAGASAGPVRRDEFRLRSLIADLGAVMHAVSPNRAIHLVGHDWGSIQGWEAVTHPGLSNRIASFTSISGPPLDHAGRWVRRQARRRQFGVLASQAVRSSYIAAFHLPGAAWAAQRFDATTRRLARRLVNAEGVEHDDGWPAATLARDVAAGMHLYRANMSGRLARPQVRGTNVPIQLIVATRDRYVSAWLLEGLDEVAADLRRREIAAGHWVIRSHPAEVAEAISEHIDRVEGSRAIT